MHGCMDAWKRQLPDCYELKISHGQTSMAISKDDNDEKEEEVKDEGE